MTTLFRHEKKRAPGLKIFLTRSGHLKSTLILTTVSII
ncbi:hypothetical protein BN2476_120028 [Paraburkholderia piptadeniae]|uniref:Uncharacterized protein n=1 Tax=Paraburkholderia piptadeniae TaxID=1701573 RepID=A0A1N7RQY9_9BURK|nr:hypothetical protein BN2476_120028 [Paraburkholderia piptadeniae]